MPSVSQAQNRAMHAAANGNSALGIPKKVGQDFVSADAGSKVGKLPKMAPIQPANTPPKVKPPNSGLQNLHAILRALRVPKIP